MQVTMQWPNADKWRGNMDSLHREISQTMIKESLEQITADFYGVERSLFMTGGGSGAHGAWPQISAKYRAWKAKHGYAGFIMIEKGLLFKSLTGKGAGNISNVSKTSGGWQIRLGTDVKSEDGFDYPLLHQTGGNIKGKTKVRRTIDPTNANILVWMRIIQRHIVKSSYRWVQNKTIDGITADREPTVDRMG